MAIVINNTGQLRQYLSKLLTALQTGSIKVDEARAAVKVAEKINESFYAELKVAQTAIQLGRKAAEFGALELGEHDKK